MNLEIISCISKLVSRLDSKTLSPMVGRGGVALPRKKSRQIGSVRRGRETGEESRKNKRNEETKKRRKGETIEEKKNIKQKTENGR